MLSKCYSYNIFCCTVGHSQSTEKEGAGKHQPALPDPSLMQSRGMGPCKSRHLAVGSRLQLSLARGCLSTITRCPHHVPSTQQTVRLVQPWALLSLSSHLPENFQCPCKVLFPPFGSSSVRNSSWGGSHRHFWLLAAPLMLVLQGMAWCRGIARRAWLGYFLVTCHVFPESFFPTNAMASCRTACCRLFLTSIVLLEGRCSSTLQPPRDAEG